MDKKNREDLEKYLLKFSVKGQEKLVGQLRQMLRTKPEENPAKDGDTTKTSSVQFVGREKLFELMDSFRDESKKAIQREGKDSYLFFELLCKPVVFHHQIAHDFFNKTVQMTLAEFKNQSFTYFSQDPESGMVYGLKPTDESKQNRPNVFDPKVESISLAGAFMFLGRLYRNLGLNYGDKFDVLFRYSKCADLAVGSIGPETFLPSVKYKKEYLTFYVVRQLHEIVGQTADMTAEIIIEILKKLRYQGIVNKDFFIHSVSKYMSTNRKE